MEKNELYEKAKRMLTNIKLGAQYSPDLEIEYKYIEGTHKASFHKGNEVITNVKAIEMASDFIQKNAQEL